MMKLFTPTLDAFLDHCHGHNVYAMRLEKHGISEHGGEFVDIYVGVNTVGTEGHVIEWLGPCGRTYRADPDARVLAEKRAALALEILRARCQARNLAVLPGFLSDTPIPGELPAEAAAIETGVSH